MVAVVGLALVAVVIVHDSSTTVAVVVTAAVRVVGLVTSRTSRST